MRGAVRFPSMNRWLLAALGVALVGVTVAFFVVPYGPHDCPDTMDCQAWGAGPRTLALLVTGVVVIALLAAAALNSVKDR